MTHSEMNNTSAESVLDDFADKFNLIRFVKAQQFNYDIALREVEGARKIHIGFGTYSLNLPFLDIVIMPSFTA